MSDPKVVSEQSSVQPPASEQIVSLSEGEIQALLWATAPYSTVFEIHESSIVADAITLVQSARTKLKGRCS